MTENEIKKTIEIERELKIEQLIRYAYMCYDLNRIDLVTRLLIDSVESSES